MSDEIQQPDHYTQHQTEVIDITRWLGFCLGNAVKYVLRAPYKGGYTDLCKAHRYLVYERNANKYIHTLSYPDNLKLRINIDLMCEELEQDGSDICMAQRHFLQLVWLYMSSEQYESHWLYEMSTTINDLMEYLANDTRGQDQSAGTGNLQKVRCVPVPCPATGNKSHRNTRRCAVRKRLLGTGRVQGAYALGQKKQDCVCHAPDHEASRGNGAMPKGKRNYLGR